ncbi:hypothetical protein COO60DRAFT_1646697 [Scenedesmus sp. NREL 46B-D3]|nr:hypothetical protein COO60DRAFT_1646697 [Scenedesmus sp. NREL 46B-D3]
MQDAEARGPAEISDAFHHPALNTDPRILCAAASTCRAWREAVQQCGARNTAVEEVDGLPWELYLEAAQQLLQQALQPAAAVPPAAAVSLAAVAAAGQDAAAAVPAGQQQQQQQRLALSAINSFALTKFTSAAFVTGMLAALPADSLTHLRWHYEGGPVDGPDVSAALVRLTNLQRLSVHIWEPPYSWLAGVAQLIRLTSLTLAGTWPGDPQQLQQLLAQPLPLRELSIHDRHELPLLDLSQLTQLQVFKHCVEGLDAVFPSQLQQLKTAGLQQLGLRYYMNGQLVAASSAIWTQLPQLCQLVVELFDECGLQDDPDLIGLPSMRQWQAIINGVAAAPNLTKLHLDAACSDDDDGDKGLTNLRHLRILFDDGAWRAPIAMLAGLANLKGLSIRRIRLAGLANLKELAIRNPFRFTFS